MSAYKVKTADEFMDDDNFKAGIPIGWAKNGAMRHLYGNSAEDILSDSMLKSLELMFVDKEAKSVVMKGSLGGWTLWKRDFIKIESGTLIEQALEII